MYSLCEIYKICVLSPGCGDASFVPYFTTVKVKVIFLGLKLANHFSEIYVTLRETESTVRTTIPRTDIRKQQAALLKAARVTFTILMPIVVSQPNALSAPYSAR